MRSITSSIDLSGPGPAAPGNRNGRAAASKTIFHVGPWRYRWVPIVFGPAAFLATAAAIEAAGTPDCAPLLGVAAALAVLGVGLYAMIRAATLTTSGDGIVLVQIGYRLEATWPDVVGVRLDRGSEGLVLGVEAGGKGAALLAWSGRALPTIGLGDYYDAEQQALLDAHRLIPIEAFAWHLRHGTLRSQIEQHAPHLCAALTILDARCARPSRPAHIAGATSLCNEPAIPLRRRVFGWIVVAVALGAGIALCFASTETQQLALAAGNGLALLSIVFRLGALAVAWVGHRRVRTTGSRASSRS